MSTNRPCRRIVSVLVMALLAVALTACGGSGPPKDPPTPAAPTASITAAASQIAAGQSVALTWASTNATSVAIAPSIGTAALPLSVFFFFYTAST